MLRIATGNRSPGVEFVRGDIQSLTGWPDASWDLAVASLCLMDLPDPAAVFRTANRLLTTGGRLIWTVVHPCFGSPHSEPHPDRQGVLRERIVRQYAATWWRSPRPGTVRGEVGAFHRSFSEYLNAFIGAGFAVDELAEPLVSANAALLPGQESHRYLPPILAVVGTKR